MIDQSLILILTGESNTGKTSLMRALNKLIQQDYVFIEGDEWYKRAMDVQSKNLKRMLNKSDRRNVLRVMPRYIQEIAENNRLVIVELVMNSDHEFLKGLLNLAFYFDIHFVLVHCDESTIAKREQERSITNPRDPASAIALTQEGLEALNYSLRIDTSNLTAMQAAQQLYLLVRSQTGVD